MEVDVVNTAHKTKRHISVRWKAFTGRITYGDLRLRCRIEPRVEQTQVASDEGDSTGSEEAELAADEARSLMRRARRLTEDAMRIMREGVNTTDVAEAAADERDERRAYKGKRRVGDARLGPVAFGEWMAAWTTSGRAEKHARSAREWTDTHSTRNGQRGHGTDERTTRT